MSTAHQGHLKHRTRTTTPATAAGGPVVTKLETEPSTEQSNLQAVLAQVSRSITPVWPLADYVAVNPMSGLTDRQFIEARRMLRTVSDIETLMPLDYYRQLFQRGELTRQHINGALDELVADGVRFVESLDVNTILNVLREDAPDASLAEVEASRLPTMAAEVDRVHGTDWQRDVNAEICKHCAAHYDRGQAVWSSSRDEEHPGASSLFAFWLESAGIDRQVEILGLPHFRKFVKQLPADPLQAIEMLLGKLRVPEHAWIQFLRTQAFSMLGWSSWTRYTDAAAGNTQPNDFMALLAMRLCYDVAIAERYQASVAWSSYSQAQTLGRLLRRDQPDESMIRFALLKADEIAYREQLIPKLSERSTTAAHASNKPVDVQQAQRGVAQIAFCIDVRSERIRRHIEQTSDSVETLGVAGFFGVSMEYRTLGAAAGAPQVPFLAKPQFQVRETTLGEQTKNQSSEQAASDRIVDRRRFAVSMRNLWRSLQSSVATTFAAVESLGVLYAGKLVRRSLGATDDGQSPVVDRGNEQSGPALTTSGISQPEQIALAEQILRSMGLTGGFGEIVMFCGHASQTENNPLAASLDCAACGGHSGEPNARIAAQLLNGNAVRAGLRERGITIPASSWFAAALHDTTTDAITILDETGVPEAVQSRLAELKTLLVAASRATAAERQPSLAGSDEADTDFRSRDWSEVRPEWGLAGNAAFIAAPRELTRDANLEGRVFLHNYDPQADASAEQLEQLMLAPMMVAHTINMQYYASTVSPAQLGSGSKTLHDVVGRFGLSSGIGGDLLTGLPWQSIHDGERYVHHPLRLLVILAAPRARVDQVLDRQQSIENLVKGGWIQLVAFESGTYYRCSKQRQWIELGEDLSFIEAQRAAQAAQSESSNV